MNTQQPKHTSLAHGDSARARILKGVDAVADAVKVTLGPAGRTVIIHKHIGMPPIVTKDGVTVADSIRALANPYEDAGAQIIKGAAQQTAASAGDGTTTSTVLAQEMIHLGLDVISGGYNPMLLKREMDAMSAIVVERISQLRKDVPVDSDELLSIARISSNNDKDLADIIVESVRAAGGDGVISIDHSETHETYVRKSVGFEIEQGFIRDAFINVPERNVTEFTNPAIILYPKKISEVNDIKSIVDACMKAERPVLFVCEDMDFSALGTLVLNKNKYNLKVCVIKLPGFGSYSKDMLEDVAIATGATVIDEDAGLSLRDAKISHAGGAEKVVITRDSTTIFAGAGNKDGIQKRIEQLNNFLSGGAHKREKSMLRKRIAILQSKAATIYVGAPTEVERREKKDRIDDALCATRAAIEEGYVAGAGNALASISDDIISSNTHPFTRGGNIVLAAIRKPQTQIFLNAGFDMEGIQSWFDTNTYDHGVDTNTAERISLIEAGIIDPAKVVRTSLENAVSVAGMLLSTACAITEE